MPLRAVALFICVCMIMHAFLNYSTSHLLFMQYDGTPLVYFVGKAFQTEARVPGASKPETIFVEFTYSNFGGSHITYLARRSRLVCS